ncbi:MAG: lysylphosphatidylglycerol synthase transmembrane domain-containing protein [Hyphomicrobiaceae bacterium]|nr:lysylphosphatidylglycerol synthase transmembrane domain-containing protein [Hyphomicrobiaceae bacterium]
MTLKASDLKFVLGLVGTIAVIAIALWLLDWDRLSAALARVSLRSVAECLAFCLLTHVLLGWRWALIAAPSDEPPRAADMFVAWQAGVFNLVTPAAIGADAYRVARGGERTGGRARTAGLVLLERLMGVWGNAAVFVVAYLASWKAASSVPAFAVALPIFTAILVGLAAGVIVLRMTRLGLPAHLTGRTADTARRVVAALTEHGPLRTFLALALSTAGVATWVLAASALGRSLAVDLGLEPVAMITVVTEFARLMPISLQGIGVREATFAWLAHEAGGSGEAGFVACGLLYTLNYLVVSGLGLAGGFALKRRGSAG